MSTFQLERPPGVTVSLPEGLAEEQVTSFKPFKSWLDTIATSLDAQKDQSHPFAAAPYQLRSITVQSYDVFSHNRLGFLKVTADIRNGSNETLPGSVFLRGPSVAMLVLLVPDDVPADQVHETDERFAVLTVQPRVPAGSLGFVELPAGMVDDSGTFVGAAAKEIEEELGLKVALEDLKDMTELAMSAPEGSARGAGEPGDLPQGVYPSAGGCDEFVRFFVHERRIPRDQLKEWTGRLTGLRDEGEKITLKLVRLRHLWREGARDAKVLSALALWEGLRREGKV